MECDYRYTSPRKREIIYTIAEGYYKHTNTKLLFSNVKEKPLKNYVTYLSHKGDNKEYTLMDKEDNCYIEDILNSNNTKEIKQKNDDGNDNKLKTENKKENKLGDSVFQLDEKNNYDLHAVPDCNPFSTYLKKGAIYYGIGKATSYGVMGLYAISGSSGPILGLTYFGGLACSGIAFYVALPSLLGFGAYKLYRWNKDRYRQEFFKDFGEFKMKSEREVYLHAINKIDNYFNKFISNDDDETKWRITNIENYIKSILDIYINIENIKFNSSLELIKKEKEKEKDKIEELIKKMNYEVKITIINISKITNELIATLTSSVNTDIKAIFDEGIPYFTEFIKIFGPLTIDEESQNKVDESIAKLIQEMKWILENKMQIGFKDFDSKVFVKSFGAYLIQKYEEKKKYELNKDQSTFISNCNEYLIEPIAYMSNIYGVLSLYMKFVKLVQDIASEKKDFNYNNNKQKLQNMKQDSTRDEININKKGNTPLRKQPCEIPRSFTANMQAFYPGNIPNIMTGNIPNMMTGNIPNINPFFPMGNYNNNIYPLYGQAPLANNYQNINSININVDYNNNNNPKISQKNENFILKFIIIGKNEENVTINAQVINSMSIKKAINNFKTKLNKENNYIKKYLIDNKIELDPSSEETLQEKGINEKTIIMSYKE